MRSTYSILAAATLAVLALDACKVGPADRGPAASPPSTLGPSPQLPKPDEQTIPIVQVAEAKGWPAGLKPQAPAGVTVTAFAGGLTHPRWLYTLPNGDVLVAETNAPERPDNDKGIRAFFMRAFMGSAGAAVPSANRITLLRDADGNGIAETRSTFLRGLNSPFGMALV